MKPYLRLFSIAAPALLVGALSVASLPSGFCNQTIAGAGRAQLEASPALNHVRYAVPTASTPVVVVYGAAALEEGAEYAIAETYAVDAAAWVAEQIQLGG